VRQLLGLFAATAIVACAAASPQTAPAPIKVPPPPPVITLGVAPPAHAALDSIANYTRTHRVEAAGCITSYAVIGDTLILGEISPPTASWTSDSLHIYSDGSSLCGRGEPTIHTHDMQIHVLNSHGWMSVMAPASPDDSVTSAKVGVWGMILVVSDSSWRIIVY